MMEHGVGTVVAATMPHVQDEPATLTCSPSVTTARSVATFRLNPHLAGKLIYFVSCLVQADGDLGVGLYRRCHVRYDAWVWAHTATVAFNTGHPRMMSPLAAFRPNST